MKTSNVNKVKNMFPHLRLFVATLTALMALTTLAQAQVFYATGGASGKVGKVTDAGVPSTFASLPDNAQGVTTDASGNLFVASGTSIYQITPGGSASVYADYANPIGGLVLSGGGTLYGVSTANGPLGGHDVGTYDALGNFTALTLTNPGFVPFYPSTSVKMDGSGNLFVTNSANGGTYGESVLKLTTADSGATWTVGAFVSYALGTFQPFDVTFDPDGNVYVSSALAGTPTINRYDSAGNLDGTFSISGITTGSFMTGMTYVNDKLYALAFGSYKIWEIDPTTGVATDFLEPNTFLPDHRSTYLTYTAVPEPSVMGLIALGALALVGRRVSRKTKS